jgi:antitoxin VapB
VKTDADKQPGGNKTAKLFMHGRSQAVRLPKEFRFEGSEVRVRREGKAVILEPIARDKAAIGAVWAEIDALRGGEDLFPEAGFDDPPADPDPRDFYDT